MNKESEKDEERGCQRQCPDCPMRNNNDLTNELDQDNLPG
ncbi:hypothetical protein METP1_02418 [Methanosarcinales archaeon]|nr:hypothetical protein METP1_02418 [Methanosarcinales archaeon]